MQNILKILILAALLGIAYLALTPYRTVQKLTYALENEDAAAVDQYVDFDAVRASLSNDFALRIGDTPANGDRTATSLVGTFLSMIASPQTAVFVFKDKSRRDDMGLSMNLGTLLMNGQWINASVFVLKNRDHKPTMMLTRTGGMHWEVTAMRFK